MADAIIDPAVLHQFDICHKVGQGAYGIVWKAIHRKQGRTVALKKCFDAFRCDVDAQRTFREVMYLRALSCGGDDVNVEEDSKKEGKAVCRGHPNIVKLINVIRADNDRDLYITFEYSETDLSHVIKARILEPTVRIDFRDGYVGPCYSIYASNSLRIIHQSTAHSIHHLPATESPKVPSQCGTIAQGC